MFRFSIALITNVVFSVTFLSNAFAEKSVEDYVESVEQAQAGMTLWQTIQAGGWVMILLAVLSVITITLIVYLCIRVQPSRLVPSEFGHKLVGHYRQQQIDVARQMCMEKDNLVSKVLLSGLDQADQGEDMMRESIELSARREVSNLWQFIGYLTDIAAVAPMIGLLGTVIGMIQAFNAIAFHTAVVKPILLAGGVSKAMVTTAAGMIVAIIAMIAYSIFRSKVQEVTNRLESYVTDMLNVRLSKTNQKKS